MADITKEALEYIANDLADPYITEVECVEYANQKMYRIHTDPMIETLELQTLSSFITFVVNEVHDAKLNKPLIHIVTPTTVRLLSEVRADNGKRDILAEANARIPSFPFGQYLEQENFLIKLRTHFIWNEDLADVMRFAGTVETGTIAEYGDDGVTQKATIRKGVASKTDAIVPGIVSLCPFRTFTEVEQVESEFVFRMRSDGDDVRCALLDADGGAWRVKAIDRLSMLLIEQLYEPLSGRFIVLA